MNGPKPAGYLKAVWPFLLGAFLKSSRPRGPGKTFQNVGGFAPHLFEGVPGPPGPARLQKWTPNKPARMPSGTQVPEATREDRPGSRMRSASQCGPAHPKVWVPEGSLAGFCWGAFLRSGRPRGPGKALKKVGGEAPTKWEDFRF